MAAGPFHFAWANANERTFGAEHIRVDEEVFSFEISHDEGDFPALDITIINPRVGLLAPGRSVWAWFSYNKSWTPEPPEQVSESESESEGMDIVPLFFGRLVGIPDDLDAEQVKLTFIARPEDFNEQKVAVAAAKKVRPYWDAIWFSPETVNDPDNVLESRPELWHIDRTTLEVTTSHILTGEDGVISLGEGDVFDDSVHISYGQAPARRVELTANVSWNQNAAATLDISEMCMFGAAYSIVTYTGDGLIQNWPKSGASIGGGWSVHYGEVKRVDDCRSAALVYGPESRFGRTPNMHDVFINHQQTILLTTLPALVLRVPRWRMAPTLILKYDVSRNRGETLTFVLEADVQSILTEPEDDDNIKIGLSSSEVAAPVDPGGAYPIRDVRRSVYFSTSRGAASIEYLIALARSRLLARARTVFVDFEIPFSTAVDLQLSCRKSVVLTDSHLPGGMAAGKIKSYSLSVDGESGVMTCAISIGCSIGKGNTVTAVQGEPTYVESGYVEPGYQRYEGAFEMPIAGEVLYESIEGLPANDDGINFLTLTASRAVLGMTIAGDYASQEVAMGNTAQEPGYVFDRLNTVPIKFELSMLPLTGGPFQTNHALNVSGLMVPKTIDLEAPSSP